MTNSEIASNCYHSFLNSIMISADPFLQRTSAHFLSQKNPMRIVSRTRDLTTLFTVLRINSRSQIGERDDDESRSISAFAHSYSDPRAIKPASEDKSSVKQRNSRGSSRKSASVSGISYDWRPVNIQARTGHVDKLLDKYVRLKYTYVQNISSEVSQFAIHRTKDIHGSFIIRRILRNRVVS